METAVCKAFKVISERGSVLGAMDTMYQRVKIQEKACTTACSIKAARNTTAHYG